MKRLFITIYLLVCCFSQYYVESVEEITSTTENPGLFRYFGIKNLWKPFWNNDEITTNSTPSFKSMRTHTPIVLSTSEQPIGIFGQVKNWMNVFKPKIPVTSLKPSFKKKTHISATSENSIENLKTSIRRNHTISGTRKNLTVVSLNISSTNTRTRNNTNSPDTNLPVTESTPNVASSSYTTTFTTTIDSSVKFADKSENAEIDTTSSTESDEDITITTKRVINTSNVENTPAKTLSEESTYSFSLNSNISEGTDEIESNIEPNFAFEHAEPDRSVKTSTWNSLVELTNQPEELFISSEPTNETLSSPNKSTLLYFSFYNADDLNNNSKKEGPSPKVVLSGFYVPRTKKYGVSKTHKRRRASRSKKTRSTKLTTPSKYFLYD